MLLGDPNSTEDRAAPSPGPAPQRGKFVGRLSWGPSGATHARVRSDRPELVNPPRVETEWYFQGEKVKWSVSVLRGDSVRLPLPLCVDTRVAVWRDVSGG